VLTFSKACKLKLHAFSRPLKVCKKNVDFPVSLLAESIWYYGLLYSSDRASKGYMVLKNRVLAELTWLISITGQNLSVYLWANVSVTSRVALVVNATRRDL